MDTTWKQHAQKPGKTPGFWNVLESNMDTTWDKIMHENLGKRQDIETFWKLVWMQHDNNMRNHAQKSVKTPGSSNILESSMDITWKLDDGWPESNGKMFIDMKFWRRRSTMLLQRHIEILKMIRHEGDEDPKIWRLSEDCYEDAQMCGWCEDIRYEDLRWNDLLMRIEERQYENLRCEDRRFEDAQMSCGCKEVRCEDLRCEGFWMWRSKTQDVTNSIFRKNKRTQKHFSTQTLFTHRRFHIPTHTLSHAHTFAPTSEHAQTLQHTHAHTFEHGEFTFGVAGKSMKVKRCDTPWWPTGAGGNVAFSILNDVEHDWLLCGLEVK